jgi:2',3'-cyclic-nucleotide 2'-phosphodiesterase (5'-nucleotidase family)
MIKKPINRFLVGYLLVVLLSQCSHALYPTFDKSQTTGVSKSIANNVQADSLIAPYRRKIQAAMSEIIGTSEAILTKDTLESSLGNFVSDALLTHLKAKNEAIDAFITNTGGLRSVMPKGPVSKGDIFELLPFENELVILTLTGRQMKELFKIMAEKKNICEAGMQLVLSRKGELQSGTIGGKAFEESVSYKILTSDYLANGGDNMSFLVGSPRKLLNIKLRDAMIEYLVANKEKTIKGNKDGRVVLR